MANRKAVVGRASLVAGLVQINKIYLRLKGCKGFEQESYQVTALQRLRKNSDFGWRSRFSAALKLLSWVRGLARGAST